jgi:rubrerythrin
MMAVQHQKIIKIFEYALGQEHTGISFFQTSIDRMGMGAAVSAFKKLITEEEKHVAFINKIIKDLKGGAPIERSGVKNFTIPESNFFDERAKSEFLQLCVEGSMIPDVTVFNTAWLIEKDLSEFYAKMADSIQEPIAKEAFDMLSHWEKGHERFFRQFRDELSAAYEKMPWGG